MTCDGLAESCERPFVAHSLRSAYDGFAPETFHPKSDGNSKTPPEAGIDRSPQQNVAMGRVGVWRGGFRLSMSVAAPFVWRRLSGSTLAPFPHGTAANGYGAYHGSMYGGYYHGSAANGYYGWHTGPGDAPRPGVTSSTFSHLKLWRREATTKMVSTASAARTTRQRTTTRCSLHPLSAGIRRGSVATAVLAAWRSARS